MRDGETDDGDRQYLLSCPFCGYCELRMVQDLYGVPAISVTCERCLVVGPIAKYGAGTGRDLEQARGVAIRRWNSSSPRIDTGIWGPGEGAESC